MTEGNVDVIGSVNFIGPDMLVYGEDAHYDAAAETIDFSSAGFDLPKRPARGSAQQIRVDSNSRVSLSEVLFTTCPPENVAWEISAREIDFDINDGVGTARGVKLDFKGVPILYTPYFSFPIDDQRKSGFLTPDIGTRDQTGFDLTIPYYLNLAPNYDLLLEPRYMSKRGMQVRSDFRYLLPNSDGNFGFEWLPDDDETDTRRSYVNLQHESLFGDRRPVGDLGRLRRSIRRGVLRGLGQQLGRDEPDPPRPLRRLQLLRAELVDADALSELSDDRPRADRRRTAVRAHAADPVRRPLAQPARDVRFRYRARELRPRCRPGRLASRLDAGSQPALRARPACS